MGYAPFSDKGSGRSLNVDKSLLRKMLDLYDFSPAYTGLPSRQTLAFPKPRINKAHWASLPGKSKQFIHSAQRYSPHILAAQLAILPRFALIHVFVKVIAIASQIGCHSGVHTIEYLSNGRLASSPILRPNASLSVDHAADPPVLKSPLCPRLSNPPDNIPQPKLLCLSPASTGTAFV